MSLYWRCQLIGWSMAAFYWGLDGLAFSMTSWIQFAVHFICDITICILLTHAYRHLSRRLRWHDLPFRQLLARIIPSILILSAIYTIIVLPKLFLVHITFRSGFNYTFIAYFKIYWLQVFVGGTRLMSIWLLAYYLYHYVQREIRTVKENAALTLVAKEAQLNNLSSQLNPHFLFNSLNNIKGLVLENPTSARRAIDLLSDLLRTSLYGREAMLIPVKEELTLVNDYLELEKLRFEDRLQFKLEVPEKLMNNMIIPFSIQALVENAIKHGINKQSRGGLVTIRIEQNSGYITTTVQNPGKLESGRKTAGLGLKNLRERLRLQFNEKAIFNITEQENTVHATILMPVQ